MWAHHRNMGYAPCFFKNAWPACGVGKLHTRHSFQQPDRQQDGVDFEDRCTRQRPTAGAHGWQLSGNRKICNAEVP